MNLIQRRVTVNFSTCIAMARTAGIIIIGDEILKGHTQDTNSYFLSKLLYSCGVRVRRTLVIGDDVDEIAAEMRNFSKNYDYVITSGGIGPTHDDKTYGAAAVAFNEKLTPNETMKNICVKYFGNAPLDSLKMKMAFIPESSTLHFGQNVSTGKPYKFPLVIVRNIYMFPGIPSLLEKQATILSYLFKSNEDFAVEEILVNSGEGVIAEVLRSCQDKYLPLGVSIGSYPDIENNYYKVKVIIESRSPDSTAEAVGFLERLLPPNAIVKNFVRIPVTLQGKDVYQCPNFSLNLRSKVDNSIKIIKEALSRYAPDEICIAFNGGKDCTALLHMMFAVMSVDFENRPKSIKSLYVRYANAFEDVDKFMKLSERSYQLDLITIEGKMKQALEKLKTNHPEIKAVLMGTRYTDPYSRDLEPLALTDSDWPTYMRINPMLDWTYHDVWEFIRTLSIPYCTLYDRGYTSLGGKDGTKKNEKLRFIDEDGTVRYSPAYTLQNGEFERNGRL